MTHLTSPAEGRLSRRSLILGAAAAALAPSLVACSKSADATNSVAVPTGPGPGHYKLDLGGYRGPELSSKTVTLRFMRQDYTPQVNQFLQSLYAKFTAAYPNVTIKEEIVPYGDLVTKLQVYVAAGNAPDLMMGRNDFTVAYSVGQIALPLEGYLTDGFVKDIGAPLREAGSNSGHLYCLPWDNNTEVLYFNRDIFKRAGVAPPPEPEDPSGGWTMEQLFEAMHALQTNLRKKGDTKTWALAASTAGNGGPGSNYTQHESFWIRTMGDRSAAKDTSAYRAWAGISDDGLASTGYLDAPEAVQGMTYYQETFKDGLTPVGAVPDQLSAGTAALSLDSFSVANFYSRPENKPSFSWGVTPWPRGKTLFGCSSSDSPIVWAKTPNPDAAVALGAYLTNDANRIQFHRLWGSIPARASLIAQMPEYQHPIQQLAVKLSETNSPAPRTVGWFDYFNTINPAVKDIALGADPAQALHAAAQKIDQNLKKYK
jgi:multiple sugar transport system substrate-binding protein